MDSREPAAPEPPSSADPLPGEPRGETPSPVVAVFLVLLGVLIVVLFVALLVFPRAVNVHDVTAFWPLVVGVGVLVLVLAVAADRRRGPSLFDPPSHAVRPPATLPASKLSSDFSPAPQPWPPPPPSYLPTAPIAVVATMDQLPGATLRRHQVVDRWDALLATGRGRAAQVVGQTETFLVARELPQVDWRRVGLAPGVLRGLAGDRRSFLVVAHTRNPRLAPFTVYLCARDYGTDLQVSWFLAFTPGFWSRLRRLFRPIAPRLDLFDEQDLRAYVTAVHHAFLDAVVALLTALGQDETRLDRTSKGFLGIS